jgi:hypothetical protein
VVARVAVRLARGADDGGVAGGEVAGGEEDTGAGTEGTAEGTAAREADALATAPLWPPSTTASVIATPAAVRTPPATTAPAPARKLTSSMRA